MKKTIRLTESELHNLINETVKAVIREGIGDDNDIEYVNDENDGDYLYNVGIWSGSGYHLDAFAAFANFEQDAIEKVVAYLDNNNEDYLFQDNDVERLAQEMREDGADDEEIDNAIEETYLYVDATMDGAKSPHYIYIENLKIVKLG